MLTNPVSASMVMPLKDILFIHIIIGQLDHQLLLLPVLEDLKHLNVQLKDPLLDLLTRNSICWLLNLDLSLMNLDLELNHEQRAMSLLPLLVVAVLA